MNKCNLITLTFLIISSCVNQDNKHAVEKTATDSVAPTASTTIPESSDTTRALGRFTLLKDYPRIKDSSEFIQQLFDSCGIQIEGFPTQLKLQKISYYKKVKL